MKVRIILIEIKMREFNYPLESNECFLYDRYGNKRGNFVLEKGKNTLPFSEELHYRDSFGNVFYIYRGEGVLEWEDSLELLDFSEFPIRDLDYFLVHLKHSLNALPNTQRKIEKFLSVYDKNIKKGFVYLAPKGFLEVEYQLVGGLYG